MNTAGMLQVLGAGQAPSPINESSNALLDLDALSRDLTGDLIRRHYLAAACTVCVDARGASPWLIDLLDLTGPSWFPSVGQAGLYRALLDLAPTRSEMELVTIGTLASTAERHAGKGGWARQIILELLELPIEPSIEAWRDEIIPIWRRLQFRERGLEITNSITSALMHRPTAAAWDQARLEAVQLEELLCGVTAEAHTIHPLAEAQSIALGPIAENQFISTGLQLVDNALDGGINNPAAATPGRLICVAARPSMGKTAFGLALARGIACSGQGSAMFFSLEMGHLQISRRLLAQLDYDAAMTYGGQPLTTSDIRKQRFTPEQRQRFASLPAEAMGSCFHFHRSGYEITPTQLALQITHQKKRTPDLCMVVIDYLTLVELPGDNLAREVGRLTTLLKRLALALNIDVVILAQLNRGLESRTNKRPTLPDLRESGRIEEDCDIVMGLYRDSYYKPGEADPHDLEVVVMKSREGATGSFHLYFSGAHAVVLDPMPVARRAPPPEPSSTPAPADGYLGRGYIDDPDD